MNNSTNSQLALRRRPAGQAIVMYQTWRSLLFLHWRFPIEAVQATLPAGLTVDSYEGEAFVGLVPFFMRQIRPRFLPAVPGISDFLETNVRTYVRDKNGRPGVWFYSLDANQRLAVLVARLTFHLPYFYAKMSASTISLAAGIEYTVDRQQRGPAVAASVYVYRAAGTPRLAAPGTLEFFLVERYLLFARLRRGRLAAGQVHHTPYPLLDVEVTAWDSRLLERAGFAAPQRPPDHAIASPGVAVDVYPLKKIV